MELVTGYGGATHVDSEDDGALNAALFGAGTFILQGGANLAATALSANSVQIADGELLMQGRHVRIRRGETETVAISNGGQGVARNDLVAARYEVAGGTGVETVTLKVIEGTASTGTPADPVVQAGDILAGDLVAEVALYRVRIDGITIEGIDRLLPVSDRGMVIELAAVSVSAGSAQVYTSMPLAADQSFYGTDAAGTDTELAFTGGTGRYTLSGITAGMTIWVGED